MERQTKPKPKPKPPHANACCSGTAYAIVDRLIAATNATMNVVVDFTIINTGIYSFFRCFYNINLLVVGPNS